MGWIRDELESAIRDPQAVEADRQVEAQEKEKRKQTSPFRTGIQTAVRTSQTMMMHQIAGSYSGVGMNAFALKAKEVEKDSLGADVSSARQKSAKAKRNAKAYNNSTNAYDKQTKTHEGNADRAEAARRARNAKRTKQAENMRDRVVDSDSGHSNEQQYE